MPAKLNNQCIVKEERVGTILTKQRRKYIGGKKRAPGRNLAKGEGMNQQELKDHEKAGLTKT